MTVDKRVDVSLSQGGQGVSLLNRLPLTQQGVPIPLGESPGPGTNCSITLNTNNDHAYDNALLTFWVDVQGHQSEYTSITITPADNANQTSLVYSVSGFAADYWKVFITLEGGAHGPLPAVPLLTSITAMGVENVPQNLSGDPLLYGPVDFTGPSAAGMAVFSVPAGLTEYSVSVLMRIISSSVDNLQNSFSTQAVYSWENIAGAVTLVPPVLLAPNTSNDALMVDASTTAGSTGTQASVAFVTPSGIDPSSVVAVTVTLLPLAYD